MVYCGFTIGVCTRQWSQHIKMTTPNANFQKIAVLLADLRAGDDDSLQAFLESQPDIDVVGRVAADRDVLESMRPMAPDVVVVCAGDSVFGGVETILRIRLQQPAVKVVLVSSALSPGNLMLALEAGVHGYVVADAGNQAVANAVRAVPVGAMYLSGEAADTLVASYMQRKGEGDKTGRLQRLSKREREVFRRLVDGESATSIAHDLALSPKTVDTYRRRLMQKIGVTSTPALVKYAVKHGVTTA